MYELHEEEAGKGQSLLCHEIGRAKGIRQVGVGLSTEGNDQAWPPPPVGGYDYETSKLGLFLGDYERQQIWRVSSHPGAFVKGIHFPLSLFVSSRGPCEPLKFLFSTIKPHGNSGGSISYDGKSPPLLLLFKANRENAETVKNALNLYYRASGQQVNLEMSSIHFAKGCNNATHGELKAILLVHNEA